MIPELDESLMALLRTRALPDRRVEVAFDAPTRDWAARRNAPTVNAYLYDIREDMTRRGAGSIRVRDERGIVTHQREPLRYFRFSYLVTCWTKQPEDEHRLLASVLGCLLVNEVLPLKGSGALASLGVPVPLSVAVPPVETRSLADIWSALGGDLKPSLDVVLVSPFPVADFDEVAPPVTELGVVGRRLDEPEIVDPMRLRRLVP